MHIDKALPQCLGHVTALSVQPLLAPLPVTLVFLVTLPAPGTL